MGHSVEISFFLYFASVNRFGEIVLKNISGRCLFAVRLNVKTNKKN